MEENLPDEIWIMILGYVPLGGRLQHVQFVNKRLHALCYDPVLAKSLDFSSAILMPNHLCKNFIGKVKEHPKSLSFRDCHWFSEDLYNDFPSLTSLKSLDLTGCHLKGTALYHLMKRTPGLKHLAISISAKEQRTYIDECLKSKEEAPKLCLETLHIESYPGGISYTDLSSLIARHFFSESNKRPKSFSLNWLTPVKSFAKLYLLPSEFTLDYECDLDLSTYDARRAFCTALMCANLHHPDVVNSDGVPNCLPRYDLTKIKFLSLPNITKIHWEFDTCDGTKCPSVLANLECLILPMMNYKEGSCYYALKHELLFSCSYPKLKCLKVTGECTMIPMDFYSKISLLKNLEELILTRVHIDMGLFFNSVKELKRLRSISVLPCPVTKRVNGGHSSSHHDADMNIVEILPELKTLEISQVLPNVASMSTDCSKLLDSIGDFKNLQKLSLCRTGLLDSFSSTLENSTNLTSLTLSHCGKDEECIYPALLNGVLRTFKNLTEVRLQHEMLEFKNRLFQEISECKNIERVILSNVAADWQIPPWYDDHIVSPTFLGHCVKLVLSKCPRLHIFVVLGNFSRHWWDHWQTCKGTLVSPDKRLILECGHPDLVTSGRSPALYKFMDFSKSSVSNNNPFNFPYSNNE